MATKKETADKVTEMEALAVRLDALQQEAAGLGEDGVAKSIGGAAKSARWADKQRVARLKLMGNLVEVLKAKGLSAEEILAHLSAGQG
jgi:hypothetical protein